MISVGPRSLRAMCVATVPYFLARPTIRMPLCLEAAPVPVLDKTGIVYWHVLGMSAVWFAAPGTSPSTHSLVRSGTCPFACSTPCLVGLAIARSFTTRAKAIT